MRNKNLTRWLDEVSSNEEFKEEIITPEEAAVGDSDVQPQEVEVVENPEEIPVPIEEVVAVVDETPVGVEGEFVQSINPEEEQELDVQMAVDSDDTMSMIDRDQIEQSIVEQQVDQMTDAQTALEAYSTLLKQSGLDGISQQTAAFLHIGLKQVERSLGEAGLTTGLENYDANPRAGILRAETVSVEDIKEYLSKAADKLRELLKRLLEMLVTGWDNLTSGITKVDFKLNKLADLATNAKNKAPSDKEYTLRSPHALFANGVNRVKDTKALSGLAHFSAYAYPEAVKKYYENLAAMISTFDPVKNRGIELDRKLTKAAAPLDKLYSSTEVLPGNKRVEIAADGIVYGIGDDDTAKEAPTEIQQKVRSLPDLKKDIKKLQDISTILKALRDEHKKIKEGADKILKEVDRLEKLASKESDLDESSKDQARIAIESITKVLRTSNPRNKEIVSYIVRSMNAYSAVIALELGYYNTEKKKRE